MSRNVVIFSTSFLYGEVMRDVKPELPFVGLSFKIYSSLPVKKTQIRNVTLTLDLESKKTDAFSEIHIHKNRTS